MAWNDDARIECQLSFKCPRTWGKLTPTETEGIRHCSECDRDVHLALTEINFRRHADDGHCVAVRVFRLGLLAEENEEEGLLLGNLK